MFLIVIISICLEVISKNVLVIYEFIDFVLFFQVFYDKFGVLIHVRLQESVLTFDVVFIQQGIGFVEWVELTDHILHLNLFVEGEVSVHNQGLLFIENVSLAFIAYFLIVNKLSGQFSHPHAFHFQFQFFTSIDRFGVHLFEELVTHWIRVQEVLSFYMIWHFLAQFFNLGFD